ncbi:M16 family metallopeptidase [Massilia sp. PWRC2]|uniref:M16 family metallopeptidase n=1 Tax=Massilia sp. PWRC2 TaxID=2804626 RepID=UPI003CE8733F
MKTLLITVSIVSAFVPCAQAADVKLPAAMPAYGKDKPIPAPNIVKHSMANGLQVWVVERSGVPRVDYVLAVRGAGYTADDKDHPGFANLMAGLLNEGTSVRDSRAIAEAAQGMGGSVGASTSVDGMLVSANAVTSRAGDMMGLLAEVARLPSFPVKEVALAKANALQSLKVQEATPGFRAERAIAKAVYGDHPYGRVQATAEAITSTTDAMLRAEHARRFRPDQALLVITGRIKAKDAIALAERAFGDWKANGAAVPPTPPAPHSATPQRILLERAGSVQSTIRLGSPGIAASTADFVPMRLASTIVGGGFSSRVNLNLREAKGYTYGASAGARVNRDGGSVIGGADVRNAVSGASLTEFFNEYKRLGTDLVSDEEMAMNKRYVAGGYLINNQMQRAVAGTLASNWLIGLPAEFLGQYVPLIQKVTPEQVRAIGKQYFAPEKQSIVVVGDPAQISEQLKAFGEFKVSEK